MFMAIIIRVIEPANRIEPPVFIEETQATWHALEGATLYVGGKQIKIVSSSAVTPADFIVRVEPD
jgi:hypothetical protein